MPLADVGVVGAAGATIATGWNYLYNLGFDHVMQRLVWRAGRGYFAVRVLHAVLFEGVACFWRSCRLSSQIQTLSRLLELPDGRVLSRSSIWSTPSSSTGPTTGSSRCRTGRGRRPIAMRGWIVFHAAPNGTVCDCVFRVHIALNISANSMKDDSMAAMIRYHEGDIPAGGRRPRYTGAVAIDTETLGLAPRRDRLCVVPLSSGDGTADVIRIAAGRPKRRTWWRFWPIRRTRRYSITAGSTSRFSFHTFGVTLPVFCTTRSPRASAAPIPTAMWLKDNQAGDARGRRLQGATILRPGAETLSQAQLEYAASDVLHLACALRDKLTHRLIRDAASSTRDGLFPNSCQLRAKLDLLGWEETDIFAHS